MTPDELRQMAVQMESARDVATEDADTLAAYEQALKHVEDAAETMRKDTVEPALDEHVEVGNSHNGVTRVEGSQRYVEDDAEAFDAVLEAGLDPRRVAKVSASSLVDALGDDATEYIGESNYTYYRRQA